MRVKVEDWMMPYREMWGRGESLAIRCRAEASWLQGAGQQKCLFMSVGKRGDLVAMFSSNMKGPGRSNET